MEHVFFFFPLPVPNWASVKPHLGVVGLPPRRNGDLGFFHLLFVLETSDFGAVFTQSGEMLGGDRGKCRA